METSPLEWVLLTTNGTYIFHFLKQTSLLFILLFFSHHTSIPPINPIDSTSEHVQFLWNRDFSHFPAISCWSKPSSFIQTIQYPLHRFSNLWPCIIFFFWKIVLTLPTYIDFLQKKQPEWCSAKKSGNVSLFRPLSKASYLTQNKKCPNHPEGQNDLTPCYLSNSNLTLFYPLLMLS